MSLKLFLCLLSFGALTGCASSSGPTQRPALSDRSQWQSVASDQSRPSAQLAALRVQGPGQIQGVEQSFNVFVNEAYVSSLLPGQTVTVSVCPGDNRLRVERDRPSAATRLIEQTLNLRLAAQETALVSISEGAAQSLALTRAENSVPTGSTSLLHTISRLQPVCAPVVPAPAALPAPAPAPAPVVAPAPPPVPVPDRVLVYRFTFMTNSHQIYLPQDKMDLDKLARDLRQDAAQISLVKVIGHADPMGSPQSNLPLSQRRANQVVAELIRRNSGGVRLEAYGVGDQMPLVANCAEISSNKLQQIDCNRVNRRVVVEIYNK